MDTKILYEDLDYQNCINDQDLMLDNYSYSLTLPEISSDFIPSPASETMDIANIQPEYDFPFSPRGRPEKSSFAGDFNFNVEVNSKDIHKKTFLYSHQLRRIYVDMNYNFSLQYTWDHVRAPHMWVRATVVYSDETQAEKRVERCVQHFHESSTAGIQKEIGKNVLHSSREIGTQGVHYCGNVDLADSWYSVLVEFVRTSAEPCSHAYKFSCKNSCPTGINRRAIAIILTLEDQGGRIYGRQTVGARVCACPRRDMLKDETAEGVYKTGKKRIPSNQIEQPKTKKIKVENLMEFDDTVHTLPPLQIVGSRATLCGLKMMLEMMELAAECRKDDSEAIALYAKPIDDLRKAVKKLENSKTPSQ